MERHLVNFAFIPKVKTSKIGQEENKLIKGKTTYWQIS